MFDGPLKKKDEEEKCAFLMLWVGEKGRSLFQTWNLTADQKKLLESYYKGFETNFKCHLQQIQVSKSTAESG